ncbi:hypothetical protein ES705_32450 [subsurface metagenome]
MTITPEIVCNYYQEEFVSNHPFLDNKTREKSIYFLKLLVEIEKELNERERVEKLSKLSKCVVDLWVMMLENALKALNESDGIEPNDTIKGITRLKHYLKSFKEFEMLLYGSNKWYRDTIYHQLWFYFVGEFLFSKCKVMEKLVKSKFNWYCVPKGDDVKEKKKAMYAFFCIISLCHDLGKPIEKIHLINKEIRKMLKNYQFLHFSPFKVEFPLTYSHMLDYLIERLSQSGEPDRKENGGLKIKKWSELSKGNVIKDHRGEDSLFVKMKQKMKKQPHLDAFFSTALSELNHGMLSCLLLMESFRRFRDGESIPISKNNMENNEDNNKIWIQKSYLSANGILKTIAYHNIKTIIISDIRLPYFWSCLVDDLIESYRPTRAGKDFISPGICDVQIIKASLKKIHICYYFDKEMGENDKGDIKDVIHFFVDKLEKYYLILEIEEFEFIIDLEMKKIKISENQNLTILMRFQYEKNNGKKVRMVKYKKDGNEIKKDGKPIGGGEEYIHDLLIKGLEKGKNDIYKEIFKEIFKIKKDPIL